MDHRLYKHQMQQLRPHEPVKEFSAWEDIKIVGRFAAIGILGLAGLVGISFAIAGLFR